MGLTAFMTLLNLAYTHCLHTHLSVYQTRGRIICIQETTKCLEKARSGDMVRECLK